MPIDKYLESNSGQRIVRRSNSISMYLVNHKSNGERTDLCKREELSIGGIHVARTARQ